METDHQTRATNHSQSYSQYERSELLEPGEMAPDFCLPSTPDQKVSLHEFFGAPIILVFYPADWSPVCGDQLALYNEILPVFKKHGATLIGISTDGVWCHLAYARDRKLRFPLLSDFEPKGHVGKLYGAYEDSLGVTARALFVLNKDGRVHWSYRSPIGVSPGADGILNALDSLSNQQPQQQRSLQ